jgi:hypothetical protein
MHRFRWFRLLSLRQHNHWRSPKLALLSRFWPFALETKKLSPLRQAKGSKQITNHKSPFHDRCPHDDHIYEFPARNMPSCDVKYDFWVPLSDYFYYYATIPPRRLVTTTKTDSAQILATSQFRTRDWPSTRTSNNKAPWWSVFGVLMVKAWNQRSRLTKPN